MEKKMTKTIPTGLIARWTGLIVLLLAVGTTGCEREWTGRIEGIVTDTETETGVSGVLVTARSEKNGY
ncbi:hypothetical protein JXA80_05065, partial [bacterium]|nr:hypothetical protein [candidate division CSSED10-310 bacterium]